VEKKYTINDVRSRVNDYWPNADINDATRKLWYQRLKDKNAKRLLDALDDVRVKYASSTPQLKWILDAYNTLQPERLALVWTDDMKDAEAEAKYDEDVRLFKEKVARDLATCTEDELCEAARSIPFSFASRKPEKWGNLTKGLVWLKLFGDSPSSASQSPSQEPAPPA
jgi:hypothetical protein|tara:strand:+ start:92 stop:595 length:504 start_codon:yes stop_codon:yes gene_type:complete